MLFVKLNTFFIIYNLLVRPTSALDGPQVYYYKRTSYTIQNPGSVKQNEASPDISPLQQPAAYYIPPMTIATMKPFITTTEKSIPNVPYFEKQSSAGSITPLNPVAILNPNHFVFPQGQKSQFSSKNVSLNPSAQSTFNKFNNSQRREEGSFCRRSFDGRSGYCIVAFQCLHVIREYRIHGTKIDICTYRKNLPVICCPLADKHIDDERISEQKCQEYHEAIRGIKIGLSRSYSGKTCTSSVPLIVGGKVTGKDEYPHMAALGWIQTDKKLKWSCGGSLISDIFVLTAAHCATSGRKPPDMVRLGATNLNRTTPYQQDIKILIVILHPKYDSSSHYYDIALLKLTKRVGFSANIQPACLWQLPDLEMTSVTATGWGRTEFMGHKSDDLQKVDLNIIDQKTCREIYRKEMRLLRGIVEEQFCAGHLEGGKDTCHGDSGGPLHAELPEYNCVKFIIGITSFGKFCAAPNAPGVYTKIYPYLDWIENIVFRN